MARKDNNKWNIKELETFFASVQLPQTAKIYNLHISDVPKFVENHLNFIKANAQKKAFKSYIERLEELKKQLEK